jgi:hypothetical protein
LNNPFDDIHKKAQDDVKNFELRENLYERRSILLCICDLATELQTRLKKDPKDINLQERFMEAKIEIKRAIRDHEHLLHGYIDMNDVVSSRMVNETIDQVMEATQEWRV